ncbi:hypothetical protein Q8F55_004109 [Vanrija albida]|uniref:Transmembrane protein n=1 Tax=Vanrija albida TaxID=181172 RepID=A0ABR3Q643_9TREE
MGVRRLDFTVIDDGFDSRDNHSGDVAGIVERSHHNTRYNVPGVLLVPHRHLLLPVFLICLVNIKSELEYRDIGFILVLVLILVILILTIFILLSIIIISLPDHLFPTLSNTNTLHHRIQ